MASRGDIELAFQRSGIGRSPTESEYSEYSNSWYGDAGKVEGDVRKMIGEGTSAGASRSGGGGDGGGDDYLSQLIATLTGQVVPKALEFDEPSARAAAEEQFGPYYAEILKDYLGEVDIGKAREQEDLTTYLSTLGTRGERGKQDLATQLETLGLRGTRGEEDLATLLEAYGIRGGRAEEDLASQLGIMGQRREQYLGDIERESPLIQEAIGGRAADRGLFFSGGREEQQRLQLEKEARDVANYEREYGFTTGQAQLGTERTLSDIERQKGISQQAAGRTQQDIGRGTEVTKQAAQRETEDIERQRVGRELESKRHLEDVEREKKQRERELAKQREQAVTGGIETRREEKFLGYS